MNTDHDRRRDTRLPALFANAADEREWQLQERAVDEARRGVAGDDDPLLAGYRQLAEALRHAPPPALPDDFATGLAARVAASPRAPDSDIEQWLLRALVAVLAMSATVATVLYGGQWLQDTLALLPAASTSWGLALGACVGLTWTLQQLSGRLRDDVG